MRFAAVAAALAAGVVMAGAASADTMYRMDASGNWWGESHDASGRTYSRLLNDTASSSDPVVIPSPTRRTCKSGWTMVDVGIAPGGTVHKCAAVGIAPGGTVHKCAAVGDLRDPE